MLESHNVHHQILGAIEASEKIIAALNSGDLEKVGKYDDKRAGFIRGMSKCHNFSTVAKLFVDEISKLAQLDKVILQLSNKLRDEVLTEIHKEKAYRLRHVQYAENLQL